MNPHKNSSFAHLSPADRAQLLGWCDEHSYSQALAQAALPREQGGLAFHASRSALARFYLTHHQQSSGRDVIDQLAKSLEIRFHESGPVTLTAMLGLLENFTFRAMYKDDGSNPTPYLAPLRLILQIKKYHDQKLAGILPQQRHQYFEALDHEDAVAQRSPDPDGINAIPTPPIHPPTAATAPAAPATLEAPAAPIPADPVTDALMLRAATHLAEILPFADLDQPKPQPQPQPEAEPPHPGNPTANPTSTPRNPAIPTSTTMPAPDLGRTAVPAVPAGVSPAAALAPTPTTRTDFIHKPAPPQKTAFYLGALKRR